MTDTYKAQEMKYEHKTESTSQDSSLSTLTETKSNAPIEEAKDDPINNSMFFIRDKVTGAVYDVRSEAFCYGVYMDPLSEGDSQERCKKLNQQLLRASKIGDLEEVKNAFEPFKNAGWIADVNTRELCNFTPLHNAVGEGHVQIVKFLLSKGAKVDAVTESSRTPLHLACYNGSKEIIQLLLNFDANINIQDDEGNTPTHILAEFGWTESLSLLLEHKPDLSIKNKCGLVASELAASIETQKLFASFSSEQLSGYSRTVIDNIVLHNNRADMIKKRMFKARFLEMTPMSVKKTEEKQSKETGNRRVKLIEVACKISNTTLANEKRKHVGPEDFQLMKLLGKGSFGQVFLVKHKSSGKLYAMKALNKAKFIGQNLMKYAKAERNVMTYNRHPFIVGLHYAFQTAHKLFLILDYCPGYVSFINH
jgi:hypothetical protein